MFPAYKHAHTHTHTSAHAPVGELLQQATAFGKPSFAEDIALVVGGAIELGHVTIAGGQRQRRVEALDNDHVLRRCAATG